MKKKILCLLTLVVVAAVGVYSFNIKDANASKTITFTEGKTTQDLKSTDGYTYPKGLTVYKAENEVWSVAIVYSELPSSSLYQNFV